MLRERLSEPLVHDEYKRVAPLYDTFVGFFAAPVRKEVCRVVQEQGCERVVDLCCGTGEQAILLDRLGIEVKGVDLSPSMIRVAVEKSPDRIEYFLEDATRLHFEDQSFDCAVLSFALHEKDSTNRTLILGEAKRILVEEGRILIVDFSLPQGFLSHVLHLFIRCVERVAGRGHYSHFIAYMKRGALKRLLEEHGLSTVYRKPFYRGTTALVLASYHVNSSSIIHFGRGPGRARCAAPGKGGTPA